MPIEIFWCTDIEDVQVYQILGKWTLDEVYTALRDGYVMSKDIEKFIIIYDLSIAQGIPRHFLSAINHMSKLHQDNVCLRVIVTRYALIKTIYSLVVKIQPKLGEKAIFVDTLDEGIARIHQFRKDLPPN